MIAVGIDVSKSKSTVAIINADGTKRVTPFEVKHNLPELNALIKYLNDPLGTTTFVLFFKITVKATVNATIFLKKAFWTKGISPARWTNIPIIAKQNEEKIKLAIPFFRFLVPLISSIQLLYHFKTTSPIF